MCIRCIARAVHVQRMYRPARRAYVYYAGRRAARGACFRCSERNCARSCPQALTVRHAVSRTLPPRSAHRLRSGRRLHLRALRQSQSAIGSGGSPARSASILTGHTQHPSRLVASGTRSTSRFATPIRPFFRFLFCFVFFRSSSSVRGRDS
eukprot:SAG31_NODE_3512_length_4172_cov_30.849251_2_plen_151_part_00